MISVAHPQQRHFNPYSENGGTILAIAGADFSVIAGDTRQSEGYSIQTRYAPKVFRLCASSLPAPIVAILIDRQDGPRGPGREWVRGRRKYVCEESQTASGGREIPLVYYCSLQ
jgi:hypothetical protein